MTKPAKPKGQRRELVRRPTALGAAFLQLSEDMGLNTENVRVPLKREPVWRVTRR